MPLRLDGQSFLEKSSTYDVEIPIFCGESVVVLSHGHLMGHRYCRYIKDATLN